MYNVESKLIIGEPSGKFESINKRIKKKEVIERCQKSI